MMNTNLENGLAKLKQAWDENPVAVLTVASLFFTATAKFVDALAGFQSKRAFAQESKMRAKRQRNLYRGPGKSF
jgi:hypothetical protein